MVVSSYGNGAPAMVNRRVAEVVVERREREERETKWRNGKKEASSQSDINTSSMRNPSIN